MRKSILLLQSAALASALMLPLALSADAKTIRACEAEWRANKETIQASGKKRTDFITECRAQTATAKPAPSSEPAPPPSAQPPVTPPATARSKRSEAAPRPAEPTPGQTNRSFNREPQLSGVQGQFATVAEAKAHCPRDTVVWANTQSKIYHFPGSRTYGKTKKGAFMCESETATAGMRVAKNEKRPPIQ